MKMKHADIQWEQPAPKGHGFSLFLWVMVLLFIAFVLVMAYAALTWKAPTSQEPGSQPQLGIAAEAEPTSSSESGSASAPVKRPDGEWNLLLVNRWNPLPENYTVDLVEVPGGQQVDERIYQPLMEMLEAAREGNLGELPQVLSGYRTQEEQEKLFQEEIDGNLAEGCSEEEARELAQQWVAVPGTKRASAGPGGRFGRRHLRRVLLAAGAQLGIRVHLAVSRGQDRPDRHRRGGLALPLCRQRGRKRDLRAGGVPGGIFGAEKGGKSGNEENPGTVWGLFAGIRRFPAIRLQRAAPHGPGALPPHPGGDHPGGGDWFLYTGKWEAHPPPGRGRSATACPPLSPPTGGTTDCWSGGAAVWKSYR